MNLVYLLGTGSVWTDNEIRFSLRSVEKHVLDLEKVFIVGECPAWLKNVIHISCEDPTPVPWRNAHFKITRACQDERINEEFLLMNDDFFFFQDIQAKNYPYYFKSQLNKLKLQTAFYLKLNQRPTKNFQIHCPIRIDPGEFLKLPEIPTAPRHWSYRSFYANYYEKKAIQREDPMIWPNRSVPEIESFIEGKTDCAIISETAKKSHFRAWIRAKFPDQSCFEISP